MEYRFDFDDQLPDLPMAFDFEEVAELFERKVFAPNASQDPVGRVHVKKLQDVKYRPSERCVTTYDLIVDRPDRAPERTIGVLEFTPEGMFPRLYIADGRLPWLSQATDMKHMQRLFSELPGFGEQATLLEIFPVRYAPSLRHPLFRTNAFGE